MSKQYREFLRGRKLVRRPSKPYRIEIVLSESFESGNEEFHLVRGGPLGVRIGGSECATALGHGSFRSRKKLVEEKRAVARWYREGKKPEEKPKAKEEQDSLGMNGDVFVQLHEGLLREPEMRILFEKLTGMRVVSGNYWTFELDDLSDYFGVLPDGGVQWKKGDGHDEVMFVALELKVSVYKAVDYLLLDHACQCFYQMWITGSEMGYYQNCHFNSRRAFNDGRTYPMEEGEEPESPVCMVLFEIYWSDDFWAWMRDLLVEFVALVQGAEGDDIPEDVPAALRRKPPPLHGRDLLSCEDVIFCWTGHERDPRKTVAYPISVSSFDPEDEAFSVPIS